MRLQVKDPELATVLRKRVELAEVRFEVVDRLEAADQLLAQLGRDMFPSKVASPLDQPAVSLERLRAFAQGGAAFHAARPWRELHDDDVVVVESPPPPEGMGAVSVLGAGGQVIGLGFYKDAKGYDRMRAAADEGRAPSKAPRWALMFHGPRRVAAGGRGAVGGGYSGISSRCRRSIR